MSLEGEATTSPGESATLRATHAIGTVFVLVMENHSFAELRGNRDAPFINGVLLRDGAHAERYFDANVHPSEPNYVWMEAGNNLAILDDDDPRLNHRTTRKHFVRLLEDAGVTWKSYQEGISGADCPLSGENGYAAKHNPMVFFDDVTDGLNASSPGCIAHVRPYAELAADLAMDHVAAYNFITPTLCHDMHDDCGGGAIANGDAWLAQAVPAIVASAAYQRGGALFITWDESEDGEAPLGMFVLSPFARPGYAATTRFDHSSLLRTLQEVFAVTPYLRGASSATGLGEMFRSFP